MIRSYEVDAAQLCDALSVVPGVDHVALEFTGRGHGVLRIRLSAGADGKDVVGAAVAGLRRRFGPELDTGRLRLTGPRGRPVVAVVDGERWGRGGMAGPGERPPAADRRTVHRRPVPGRPVGERPGRRAVDAEFAARVAVEDVEVVTEAASVRATVRLRSRTAVHTGTAAAAATPAGGHRAVVAATARAVELLARGRVRLDVEAVDVIRVGPDRVGVVVLALVDGSGAHRLTGSALLREDLSDTLVRATLDAVNRCAVVASSAR